MELLTMANASRTIPIRRLSNDLFADFVCGAKTKNGICSVLVQIPTGYCDHYFFAHVNAENRPPITCEACGTTFVYRWTPAAVLLSEVVS